CDRYGIRSGGQRRGRRGWGRRIDRGETDGGLERIFTSGRKIPNIHAGCWSIVYVYFHWRGANHEGSANDVTWDSRLHEETVRVSAYRVLLNDVVVGAITTL